MSLQALLHQYNSPNEIWDEMLASGNIREHYSKVVTALQHLDVGALHQKDRLAAELFMNHQ